MTVLFLLILFAAFTIQSLTGFGGPLIAMPLSIPAVGVDLAKPVITLWNKSDLVDEDALFRDFGANASVKISAKTGAGLDEFYSELTRLLRESRIFIDTVIPYKNTAVVAEIRKAGQLLSEEYEEDGVHITAYVPRALAGRRGFAE